jgi:two-component sensor histidine kinase
MWQSQPVASSGAHVPVYLLQESHHRMSNSLTILAATLRRQLAGFRDDDSRLALRRCEQQILAASELHRVLGAAWGPVNVAADIYFQSLCELLSRSMLSPLGIRCEAFVTDGDLSCEKRGYLSAILVELVSNAAKHAFQDEESNCVRIEIEATTAQWSVRVIDNGHGIRCYENGTDSQLVNNLVKALSARLTVDASAHRTSICVALDA